MSFKFCVVLSARSMERLIQWFSYFYFIIIAELIIRINI